MADGEKEVVDRVQNQPENTNNVDQKLFDASSDRNINTSTLRDADRILAEKSLPSLQLIDSKISAGTDALPRSGGAGEGKKFGDNGRKEAPSSPYVGDSNSKAAAGIIDKTGTKSVEKLSPQELSEKNASLEKEKVDSREKLISSAEQAGLSGPRLDAFKKNLDIMDARGDKDFSDPVKNREMIKSLNEFSRVLEAGGKNGFSKKDALATTELLAKVGAHPELDKPAERNTVVNGRPTDSKGLPKAAISMENQPSKIAKAVADMVEKVNFNSDSKFKLDITDSDGKRDYANKILSDFNANKILERPAKRYDLKD